MTDYMPGQRTTDAWVLYPEVGTYTPPEPEDCSDIVESIGGQEQVRILWPYGGKSHAGFRTMPLDQGQMQEMRDFLRSLRGEAVSFYWFEFVENFYYHESVATGDGTDTVTIPFRDCNNLTGVWGGGAPLDALGFGTSALPGGENTIVFSGPVSEGVEITATFKGKKRYLMRLETRRVPRPLLAGGGTIPVLWQFEIPMVERLT